MLAGQRAAREQQPCRDSRQARSGRLAAHRPLACVPYPRQSCDGATFEDLEVAGEQRHRQTKLLGSVVGGAGLERADVAAEPLGVAAVGGEDGREHLRDRAAVGVRGRLCSGQGEVALAVGVVLVAEEPERVGQASPDDQFGVLAVAQDVRAPARRPETLDRGVEVRPRSVELPGPVGGDAQDVVAFYPQDLVAVALGAGAQPLAEVARRCPLATCEGSQRERPDQRRFRLAAELFGEPKRARVHLRHPRGCVALVRHQRRRERRQQPQPEHRCAGAGREVLRELQRALERVDGVGMGVQPLGGLRCPLMPADGLGGRTGVLVVKCERRRGSAFAVLERPRDREMCLAAAGRAERGVGAVADPAMAEVVGVGAVGADDPATPELVQGVHERRLVEPAGGRGEHVGGERAADRRGDPGELGRRRRQLGQATSDDCLHLLSGRRRVGLQRLHHEQRIALAVAVEALEFGRVQRRVADARGQQRRLLAAEPAELDLAEASARSQGSSQRGQRVARVELLAAGGRGDQQPGRRRRAHEVVHDAQRLPVGPLRVVDDQQQRRARRQQRSHDRGEQPASQLVLRQRLGRRHVRAPARAAAVQAR